MVCAEVGGDLDPALIRRDVIDGQTEGLGLVSSI